MEREKLGSRLGFLLLSAGCAIGLGNVWKFPYMVGQGGGGAFVLFYILFLIVLGLPVMTMEFSIGRAAQKSPVKMYQELEQPGQKWHIHGWASMAGNYLLMMFYLTVAGWIVRYFVTYLVGGDVTAAADAGAVSAAFGAFYTDMEKQVIYTWIVVAVGFFICSFGIQKGVEKVTKYMMLLLFALMVLLAVHGVLLDKSGEGLAFYLKPDLSKINGNVLVGAMNQAFFTLSLGIGSMAIFGSYIGKKHTLMGESARVIALDTFAALMAGFIIFPSCFAYGVSPGAGPGLIFETLPNVFNHMAAGRFWGAIFFLFFSFAAMSTVIAVFENIIAMTMDAFGWSRKKSCVVNFLAFLVLTLPMALSSTVLVGFTPFGAGSGVLDLFDFIVSNNLLPLGSLCYVIYCTRKAGWGWDKFKAEANAGAGMKVGDWMKFYATWILPLIILVVYIIGMADMLPKIGT